MRSCLVLCSLIFSTQAAPQKDSGGCGIQNGKDRGEGESWKHSDGCNTCVCYGGSPSCTLALCEFSWCTDTKDRAREQGEEWSEDCKRCMCNNGIVACENTACFKNQPTSQVIGVKEEPSTNLLGVINDKPTTKLIGRKNVNCGDFEGKIEEEGSSWPHEDGCNFCRCRLGLTTCTRKLCSHPVTIGNLTVSCQDSDGGVHPSGSSWPHRDGCNECRCQAAVVTCSKLSCPTLPLEDSPCVGCPPRSTPIVPTPVEAVQATGDKAELASGDKAELASGDKAELTSGDKADLTSGDQAVLTSGDQGVLTSGNQTGHTGVDHIMLTPLTPTLLTSTPAEAATAARVAASTLAGTTTVTTCGLIRLMGIDRVTKQVGEGILLQLALRLGMMTGEDCSLEQEKICENISVVSPLPADCICEGNGCSCLEVVNQEEISCKLVGDHGNTSRVGEANDEVKNIKNSASILDENKENSSIKNNKEVESFPIKFIDHPNDSIIQDQEIDETPDNLVDLDSAVPCYGCVQPTNTNQKVYDIGAAAAERLSMLSSVSSCGLVKLNKVVRATRKIVTGTNYNLTLKLETRDGENCLEKRIKVCENVVMFEALPFTCRLLGICLELIYEEQITCSNVVD